MSDRPQRTNTSTAEPVSGRYRECLFDWLAAHAPFWNQINYRRRQQYFDEHGDVLEDRYDFAHPERVTLQVRGGPQWRGDDSRLELIYDEHADQLRLQHPISIRADDVQEQRQAAFTPTLDDENTARSAATDVGANNTLAVVTETGDTAVYHARPEFERFQQQSERIVTLQPELLDDQYTSKQIQRVYDVRSRQRGHSRGTAVKDVAGWLLKRHVETVCVGDLTDVLGTYPRMGVLAVERPRVDTRRFWGTVVVTRPNQR